MTVMSESWREWHESLYGAMVDVLKAEFGVEFQLWDTGGGCDALVGEFEGDVTVYITDAPNSPHGRECQITDQPTRDALDHGTVIAAHGGSTVGFAVGVYRDDHCTNVAYGEYPNEATADLPVIVAEQLTAAKGKP